MLNSGIYQGWVRHRRYLPRQHQLKYRVFMMLLDLDELERVFSTTRLWSKKGWALARFKREDFLGDKTLPLDQAVRQRVEEETGIYPRGSIRMLANLRYFGFIINPIACYYCFDENEELQFIVAEVNNTPWDERHAYVLPCDESAQYQKIDFDKSFHVSPFNPMDIKYHWRSNLPGKKLRIHMQNWRNDELEFDATVALERREITPSALRGLMVKYPFMTAKVVLGIYWEAMKLYLKRVPVYDHPKNNDLEVENV